MYLSGVKSRIRIVFELLLQSYFSLIFGGFQFQAICGIVTCLDNNPHKLETGQFVTFREINGMTSLNGSTHQISGKPNFFQNVQQ